MKLDGKHSDRLRARDGHRSVFQRLPQNLQHVAREFGKFVEKQHAVVREAHFAGPRRCPTRRPPCPRRKWCGAARGMAARAAIPRRCEQPGDAVDLGGLDGFLKSQRRQNAGHPLGQHRLAGARRPDHQDIVRRRRPPLPARACAVVCPRTSRKSGAAMRSPPPGRADPPAPARTLRAASSSATTSARWRTP